MSSRDTPRAKALSFIFFRTDDASTSCTLRLGFTSYALDATTDFLNWTPLKTNETTDGTFDYVDQRGATEPCRFYRGRLVSP